MKRQIKFRAWDTSDERGPYMLGPYDFADSIFNIKEVRKLDLMQFTGLYDRDGNEVYEGDILLNYDRSIDGSKGEYMAVEYDDDEACFMTVYQDTKQKFPLSDSIQNLYCVVGNIYENPDLVNSEQGVQESDTTKAEKSDEAGNKKTIR